MGGKPLVPNSRGQQTTVVKALRLTKAEARVVNRMAAELGLSFSAFARKALLDEIALTSQAAEVKIVSVRGFLDKIAARLHAQARRRLEAAEREERAGGSGAWGVEEGLLLRRVGDAILAAAADDGDDGDGAA